MAADYYPVDYGTDEPHDAEDASLDALATDVLYPEDYDQDFGRWINRYEAAEQHALTTAALERAA